MSERSHVPHHRNLVHSVLSRQCRRRTHLTVHSSPGRRVAGSPSCGRQRRGCASWRNKAPGAVGTAVWRNGGTKPIRLDPRSRHVSVFTATPARPRDFAKFQNELIWSFSMKSANTARRRARAVVAEQSHQRHRKPSRASRARDSRPHRGAVRRAYCALRRRLEQTCGFSILPSDTIRNKVSMKK